MGQIRSFRKDIAVAGTRERIIEASTPALWAKIDEKPNNSGTNAALKEVVIGSSDVVQAPASRVGILIDPVSGFEKHGAFLPTPVDLMDVWADVGTNNNGIICTYMEP